MWTPSPPPHTTESCCVLKASQLFTHFQDSLPYGKSKVVVFLWETPPDVHWAWSGICVHIPALTVKQLASTSSHADNTAKINEGFNFNIQGFVFCFSILSWMRSYSNMEANEDYLIGVSVQSGLIAGAYLCAHSLCQQLSTLLTSTLTEVIWMREGKILHGRVRGLCVPDPVQSCSRVKGPVKIT